MDLCSAIALHFSCIILSSFSIFFFLFFFCFASKRCRFIQLWHRNFHSTKLKKKKIKIKKIEIRKQRENGSEKRPKMDKRKKKKMEKGYEKIKREAQLFV